MNDLEITKRVAEIDGVPRNIIDNDLFENIYRPLHNGGLICNLIVKYNIDIRHDNRNQIWAEIYDDDDYSLACEAGKSLGVAVCHCLIKAYEYE